MKIDKPIKRMGYTGTVRESIELLFSEMCYEAGEIELDLAEEIIRDQRYRAMQSLAEAKDRDIEAARQNTDVAADLMNQATDRAIAAEAKIIQLESEKTMIVELILGNNPGEVTMQNLNDAGINPFGVQLVCESFVKHCTAKALKFKFNGVIFHFGVNFEEALTNLSQQAQERDAKLREAAIDECLSEVQKRIDSLAAIPVLSDKAKGARRAWKVIHKAITQLKQGGE